MDSQVGLIYSVTVIVVVILLFLKQKREGSRQGWTGHKPATLCVLTHAHTQRPKDSGPFHCFPECISRELGGK